MRTKTEKTFAALVRTDDDEGGEFYSLRSDELRAIRRYLRGNKESHSECRYWLRYFKDFIPTDRPKKGPFGTNRATLDDYPDFLRFAAFGRQLLAINGIVVA